MSFSPKLTFFRYYSTSSWSSLEAQDGITRDSPYPRSPQPIALDPTVTARAAFEGPAREESFRLLPGRGGISIRDCPQLT